MFTLKHVKNHKSYGSMGCFVFITTFALKNAMLRAHIGSCMPMDSVIILFANYVMSDQIGSMSSQNRDLKAQVCYVIKIISSTAIMVKNCTFTN